MGELCDLRLSNFDRRQGTLIVFGKGRKERRVALGRNALRVLLYYLDRWRRDDEELKEIGNQDEDHLFLSEGGQALTVYGIEMLFKRLRSRSGPGSTCSAPIPLFTCSTSNVAFRPVVPQVTSKCVLSY